MKSKSLTYYQLEKEFDRKVKELQDRCPHKRITKWMEGWWAPGHGTGTSTRLCKRCNAQVYSSYTCKFCDKCKKQNPWYVTACGECEKGKLITYFVIERLGNIIKKEKLKEDLK